MIAEAAQAAQEVAKANPVLNAGVIGLVITNATLLVRDYLKSRAEKQKARDAVDEAEAQALKAQAQALSEKGKSSEGGRDGHEKFFLDHALMLEGHEREIKALKEWAPKIERENREDHGKLFTGIGELKDLIIERLPRAGN